MKAGLALGLGALSVLLPGVGLAAHDSPRPLFASQDVVHLTIQAPVRRLAGSPTSSSPSVDGTILVEGEAAPAPVQLSARGNSRRQLDVCSFPPIRVTFTSPQPKGTLFHDQKKLKLVTHCQSQADFQQYVLLEYAAYRLYNVITPLSFDVRLAKVDYVEPSGKPIISRIGFFIESEAGVARRNGLKSFKGGDHIPLAALQPQAAARTAMFEDMIGNLDWAMTAGPQHSVCCHNTKPVGPEGATAGLIPVPHDFDMAGMVDPPYAVPPPGITAADVTERQYRGFCVHNAEAEAAAADILSKRAALLAVFDQVPGLEARPRAKAVAYLNSFFDQLANPDAVHKMIKGCLR